MKLTGLREDIEELRSKKSKASRIKRTLEKQKGLIARKDKLADFKEPLLILRRRDGNTDTYENATKGRMSFRHSSGQERDLILRPEDQGVLEYGGRKVRCYIGHEDYPFANFPKPIKDSEEIFKMLMMVQATNRKFEESMERLKQKSKMTWVWIALGVAGAFAIGAFAYNTWIVPSQIAKARSVISAPPSAGIILLLLKNNCRKFINRCRLDK